MALIECEARVMCESVLERQKIAGREAAVNLDGCVYLCSSSNGYYGYMPVQRQWECAMDTSEPERQLVVQSTAVVISGSSPAASRRRKHSSAGDAQLASKRARHEVTLSNFISRRERPVCRKKGDADSLENLLKGIHGCEMYHYLNVYDV